MGLTKKKTETFEKYRTRIERTHYRSWIRKPVYCPALKKKVFFTQEGWDHIAGIQKQRERPEVYRRIRLLRFVRSILKRSGTIQGVRIVGNETFFAFESIEKLQEFLNLGEKFKRIKVVVKTKKTGGPIFFSVME